MKIVVQTTVCKGTGKFPQPCIKQSSTALRRRLRLRLLRCQLSHLCEQLLRYFALLITYSFDRLLRQHSDAQQVAPLILEIDGGAVLDGGEAELFYIGPLAASTLRDASNESFCLLECPRIVMFATSTGTVLTGFASFYIALIIEQRKNNQSQLPMTSNVILLFLKNLGNYV